MIWLVLVAVVFLAGGTWFVAKSMQTRALVLLAGLAAVGAGLCSVDDLRPANPVETVVAPRIGSVERQRERARWRAFVDAATSPGITGGA